jgi:nucleoside triphosphate diphosphatase
VRRSRPASRNRCARAKILEELEEIASAPLEQLEEEVGDLLFAVVNFARHLKIDPEAALRSANAKFERRFRAMEAMSLDFASLSLDEKEALWVRAKADQARA